MKTNVLLVLAMGILFTSCASVGPTGGMVYHDIKYGRYADATASAKKTGEACQSSVLGLVGHGDASIEAAKKMGEIKKVATIDASSFSLLWFYNKYCTIVTGE